MNSEARIQKLIEHLAISSSSSESSLQKQLTLSSDDNSIGARVTDIYHTFTGKVPFSFEQHGGHLVAKVLQAHGVKFIFTLCGGHISPILAASEERGIRIIDTRHEATAVFAADAVGRLSGICGVAAVTAGPGLTNTITALKNAQMAESPLILLTGAASTLTKGRGALQDVDQLSILKSVCKFIVTVTSVRDIVPALRRAFREAMSGVPGPVTVELPIDVLYPSCEAQAGMGLIERKYKKLLEKNDFDRILVPIEYKTKDDLLKSLGPNEAVFLEKTNTNQPWFVDQYMKYKLKNIFAGAWDDEANLDCSPLPIEIPNPLESDVLKVVEYIRQAKRPVLLIGSQSTLGGIHQVQKLAKAVEDLGIPCFLGGMARGLLGRHSSTQIRQNRGGALKKADLIILAGAICDFRLGYGRDLPTSAKIISINRGREAATMNMGVFWNSTLLSISDPSLFIQSLANKLGSSNSSQFDDWRKGLKDAEIKKDESNRIKAKEKALGRVSLYENGPTKIDDSKEPPELINPLALLLSLEDTLPDNAILVTDGGDFVATSAYTLRPRAPLAWLDSGAFGTLGCGAGFAIGAKLCCPEKEVYLIWGDGSSCYGLAELDTFVKHRLPIIALIGNDAAWTQIEREQIPMFNTDVGCALRYLDYDVVGKGFGADGLTIKDPKTNFKEIFEQVREKHKQGASVVINALIGRTNFREGSISV